MTIAVINVQLIKQSIINSRLVPPSHGDVDALLDRSSETSEDKSAVDVEISSFSVLVAPLTRGVQVCRGGWLDPRTGSVFSRHFSARS